MIVQICFVYLQGAKTRAPMTDKLTPEQRHKCMSRIRAKNTKPEIIVRKFLFAHGYRFRINVKRLPGTPDIVLRKYRTVIFVNGCFWHGHEGCRYFVIPKSNIDFWTAKIERNRVRDLQVRIKLRDKGWHVIQLWECQLKPKVREENLAGLLYTLNHLFLENYSIHHVRPYAELKEDTACVAESETEQY